MIDFSAEGIFSICGETDYLRNLDTYRKILI